MKLDHYQVKRREFKDARTGRVVWQVTNGEGECCTPYMDKYSWSSDDRYLVFSGNRTGSWQPYRLEIDSGEVTQLCHVEKSGFRSIAVAPKRNEVFWSGKGQLIAVNLHSLQVREALNYEVLSRATGFEVCGATPVLNDAGTLIALTQKLPDESHQILLASTDGSNEFQAVRLQRKDIRPVHLQFCPGDDNLISFNGLPDFQDDPGAAPENRVREWLLKISNGFMQPLVLVDPGYRATHCNWGRSGKRIYFHRKTVPGWVPTALCSVDVKGMDFKVHHETMEHRLGHSCASPDENLVVTDSQEEDENILMLLHIPSGKQQMLCWPNMSYNSRRADRRLPGLPPHTDRHTHPAFSFTGMYIHYNSDISGRTQVYVVKVCRDDLR